MTNVGDDRGGKAGTTSFLATLGMTASSSFLPPHPTLSHGGEREIQKTLSRAGSPQESSAPEDEGRTGKDALDHRLQETRSARVSGGHVA